MKRPSSLRNRPFGAFLGVLCLALLALPSSLAAPATQSAVERNLAGLDAYIMSLDEAEVTFSRKPDPIMSDPQALAPFEGTYETPSGVRFQIAIRKGNRLARITATGAETLLDPVKPWVFRVKAFSDVRYEFVVENGLVKALKIVEPAGEFVNPRIR